MSRKLIIDGNLLFPPSEICCVRDITLYVRVIAESIDTLLQVDKNHVDTCYHYMKATGCFDYIDDIIAPGEESGIYISSFDPCNIKARKIWAGNLNRILSQLRHRLS